MADINIPGVGGVDKKYVIAGVLAGAGIAGVVYIRRKKNASAAPAPAAAGTVTDPAGNTCAVLDSNSGYCPGSPEDTAYQENVSGNLSGLGYGGGYGGGGGTGVSLAGLVADPAGNQCSAVNPATGFCPGTQQDLAAIAAQGGHSGNPGGATTNTDWINEALSVIPGDQTTIRTALVDVLAGMTVTSAQKNIFEQAVGVLGQPPQSYPQPIKTSDTSAHPGTPGKYAANPPKNLRLVHNGKTGVEIEWDKVAGAAKYNVHTPGRTPLDFTTTNTIAEIGNLKPGTTYTVEVWADPTPAGGPHATRTFTTSK